MKTINEIIKAAEEVGFTHVVELDCDSIQLLPEVRDMCAADKCHAYNHNWACPPGCGSLSECESRIRKFKRGVIVQSVGELEDEMDYETMMELQEEHSKHFVSLTDILRKEIPDVLPIGSGTCSRCESCTFPDLPCRFPGKMTSSMEAYGMLVSQVCKDNNIPYYYGKNTLAYTSCFLID